MWAIFAISTAVLTSFNPIFFKRMLRDADSLVVVWGVTLLSLPLLGLSSMMLTPHLPAVDGWFVVGVTSSAILNVFAQLASTRALKLADVSLVTPLLIFSPIFTVFISAVFLNEIPTLQGWLGVACVLIGAYWLNHYPGAALVMPVKTILLTPGALLVLLAGLFWAITPLFEKVAIQHTRPESPSLTAFAATALLTLILTPAVWAGGKLPIQKLFHNRRDLFAAGVISGIAPVLGYTAFSLGFVGYVTTLFKLSTLMTVIWSFLFLKERDIVHRLPGSLMMVIGSILLAV